MKKIVLAAVMAVSVWAEAGGYFGVGVTGGSENYNVANPGVSKRDTSASFQAVEMKLGYGNIKAYAVELDLGYGRYDQNVFSTQDGDYLFFDLSLIKAFETPWSLYPFFKLGFGTGELSVARTTTESISSGSWFGGGGIYWSLGAGFDLETSVIYSYKRWQGLDMIGSDVTTYSWLFQPYIGLNWRF